jgi:hypothetical protein
MSHLKQMQSKTCIKKHHPAAVVLLPCSKFYSCPTKSNFSKKLFIFSKLKKYSYNPDI